MKCTLVTVFIEIKNPTESFGVEGAACLYPIKDNITLGVDPDANLAPP